MRHSDAYYNQNLFTESPIFSNPQSRAAKANRFANENSRQARQQRTPYDVPMSQSQKAMEICSQQNRSKNESSRTQGNVFTRVVYQLKDTVVGCFSNWFQGSQPSQVAEEESKKPQVSQSSMVFSEDRQEENADEIVFRGRMELDRPSINFQQLNQNSLVVKSPKNRRQGVMNKTEQSTSANTLEQLLNEDSYIQNKSEGFERITFNNISQGTRDQERLAERKNNSIWTKFNVKQFKTGTLPMKQKNPITFLQGVRQIVMRTRKNVLTADNRIHAYGLQKLREDNALFKPIALKVNQKEQEMAIFGKRKHLIQAPQPKQQLQKKMKTKENMDPGKNVVTVTNLNQKLEVGKLKTNVTKVMSKQDMEEFKKGAILSKMKADQTHDQSHMDRFINQQVRAIQPKLIAQQLKVAENRMRSNNLTQEESKLILQQILEMKRQIHEVHYLQQQKQEDSKAFAERWEKSQEELIVTVVREWAQQILENQERLAQTITNSQSFSQPAVMSQQEQLSEVQNGINDLNTKFSQMQQDMQLLALAKAQNEITSTSTKAEVQQPQKLNFPSINPVKVQEQSTPQQNEKKVDFQLYDDKKTVSEEVKNDKIPSPEKLISFGDKLSDKVEMQSDVSSFKSERISTPSSKGTPKDSLKGTTVIQPSIAPQVFKFEVTKPADVHSSTSSNVQKASPFAVTFNQPSAALPQATPAITPSNPLLGQTNIPNPFIKPSPIPSNSPFTTASPFTSQQPPATSQQPSTNPFFQQKPQESQGLPTAAPVFNFQQPLQQNTNSTMQCDQQTGNPFGKAFQVNTSNSNSNVNNSFSSNTNFNNTFNKPPTAAFQQTTNQAAPVFQFNIAQQPSTTTFKFGQQPSQQQQQQPNPFQMNTANQSVPPQSTSFTMNQTTAPSNPIFNANAFQQRPPTTTPTPQFQSPFSTNNNQQQQQPQFNAPSTNPFAMKPANSSNPFQQQQEMNSNNNSSSMNPMFGGNAQQPQQEQSSQQLFSIGGVKKPTTNNDSDDGLFSDQPRQFLKAKRNQARK